MTGQRCGTCQWLRGHAPWCEVWQEAEDRITLDGVEIHASPSGRVTWMSAWERCDELAGRGLLRREHYGAETYGHVDFYIPEQAR